ncbi:MAG: hypothetical protein OES13_06980 [Acidimicrobiia bacterium]|nr:hypothetical protein [Acidimicrobiia bacterium]
MQGHLRNEPVSITVDTQCAHCSEPITLEIDSEMNVQVEPAGADPMVFIPDVRVFDVKAPSIIDDF